MKRDVSKESKRKYVILLYINDRKHQMPCDKIESFFFSYGFCRTWGDMSNSLYGPGTFLLIAQHNSNEENTSNYA